MVTITETAKYHCRFYGGYRGKRNKKPHLDEALILFAENGYRGTDLRDLAARLGLSKSALYKHYESKEDIWNALLDKMEAYYARRFGSADNFPKMPDSCEELMELTMQQIRFTLHDPQIILTRKLLLTEQLHDQRVCKLATKHFLESIASIYEKVFASRMEKGSLRKADPAMLAFSYTAHISSLIHLCDREPDRQEEAMDRIQKFVRYFIATHKEDLLSYWAHFQLIHEESVNL